MKRRTGYGFKGQLARIVKAAMKDNDRVSMLKCGETEQRPEFAVVVIKGHQEVEAFRRWAAGQRLLTPGHDSGMLEAVEGPKCAQKGLGILDLDRSRGTPTATMHAAASVDIDRFSDARLRKVWLPMFRQLGCETPQDIRKKCAEARAQGLEVFPPCDNTGPTGACLGHSESENS